MLEHGIEENAKRYGETAVAAMEVGEPGEYIEDPDFRLLEKVMAMSC